MSCVSEFQKNLLRLLCIDSAAIMLQQCVCRAVHPSAWLAFALSLALLVNGCPCNTFGALLATCTTTAQRRHAHSSHRSERSAGLTSSYPSGAFATQQGQESPAKPSHTPYALEPYIPPGSNTAPPPPPPPRNPKHQTLHSMPQTHTNQGPTAGLQSATGTCSQC